MRIELAGEEVVLRPEKALFWPRRQMLVAADLHLGKGATFRANGIPVPETGDADLARLAELVHETGARRLLILGDFFHAAAGRTAQVHEAIARWRQRLADVEVILVLGNHDRAAGRPLAEWNFTVHEREWVEGPFVFRHHPEEARGGYVLAGHIHPSVRLSGGGSSTMRVPCFLFGDRRGILPAFGGLTGTHAVEPGKGERVVAVADGRVISLPARLFTR